MRKLGGILGGLVVLGLVWPVGGQQPLTQSNARSFMTGADPQKLTFKPVDTSRALKQFNMSNTMHRPSQMSALNPSRLFPKFTLGTWPPKLAQVSILPQKQNPFQPKVPVGKNPFSISPKK